MRWSILISFCLSLHLILMAPIIHSFIRSSAISSCERVKRLIITPLLLADADPSQRVAYPLGYYLYFKAKSSLLLQRRRFSTVVFYVPSLADQKFRNSSYIKLHLMGDMLPSDPPCHSIPFRQENTPFLRMKESASDRERGERERRESVRHNAYITKVQRQCSSILCSCPPPCSAVCARGGLSCVLVSSLISLYSRGFFGSDQMAGVRHV